MSVEYDLLQDWFDYLLIAKCEYREPLFGAKTNLIVKKTCDALKQDGHVFVLSLEILEKYAHEKNQARCKIKDELWTVCVCILIASKCTGDIVELKTKHLEAYVRKLMGGKSAHHSSIRKIELDVLSTIRSGIPATTKLDDVVTVAEKFIRDFSLSVSLLPACVRILELLCVTWRRFFSDLRALYAQNKKALSVFRLLVTNRAYVPVGIVMASLHISHYKYILNTEKILNDYSVLMKIHRDHIYTLVERIVKMVTSLGRQEYMNGYRQLQ